MQEVIDKMVEDCRAVGNAETLLRDYCGIVKNNYDSGAVSGWEMGGVQAQSLNEVLPETLPAQEIEDFTNTIFTRRNLTVYINEDEATLSAYNGGKQILNNAYSWYIEESVKLIEDYYGFYFKEGDILTLELERNSNVAGRTYLQTISLDTTDKGTLAHEMTHLAQNYFIGHFAGFLQEGLAELTGGDHRNYDNYAANADLLAKRLDVTDFGTGTDYYYTVGYMFYRYITLELKTPNF